MKRTETKSGREFSVKSSLKGLFMSAMIMISAACSTEKVEPEVPVTPVFPKAQTMMFDAVGVEKQLEFEANTPWTLISNVPWCQFVQEGEKTFTISGEAGKQSVTINITDEGQSVASEQDQTDLEIMMGDKKKVVATIVRSTAPYAFTLLDAEGKPLQESEWTVNCLSRSTYTEFSVLANFAFIVKSHPSWISFAENMVGVVGHPSIGRIKCSYSVTEHMTKEPGEEDVIVFSSEEENGPEFKVKVRYPGCDPEFAKIEVYQSSQARKDWEVTLDGQTFTQENSKQGMTSTTLTKEGVLKFNVVTLNNNSHVVVYEKNAEGKYVQMSGASSWISIVPSATQSSKSSYIYEMTVNPTELEKREAVAFALPDAVYQQHSKDLDAYLVEADGKSPQLSAKVHYLLVELTQKKPAPKPAQMKVNTMGQDIELKEIKVDFPNQPVGYELPQNAKRYTIDPMLGSEFEFFVVDAIMNPIPTDKVSAQRQGNNVFLSFRYPFKVEAGNKVLVVFKQYGKFEKVLQFVPAAM